MYFTLNAAMMTLKSNLIFQGFQFMKMSNEFFSFFNIYK